MPIDADIIEPSVDPNTRKLAVRNVVGENDAGTRTEISVRDYPPVITDEPSSLGGTNSAPSPIETLLAALVGCEGVIIRGVASAINFEYSKVEFKAESQIDLRGPKGVPGVRPYFETVTVDVILHTEETPERIEKLKKNVEFRCPIVKLLRAADVELTVNWTKKSAT